MQDGGVDGDSVRLESTADGLGKAKCPATGLPLLPVGSEFGKCQRLDENIGKPCAIVVCIYGCSSMDDRQELDNVVKAEVPEGPDHERLIVLHIL